VAAAAVANPARTAWTANLGAAVYGQPLAGGGRIYAATERNRVVALNPANGAVLWSVSIGKPLTDVDRVAGCGDVDPLGVTSTPALDSARGVLYVVGEISDGGGRVHHQLVGLNAATGSVELSEDVDPPLPDGERRATLLQRAGLALANGRVYVSYGGNDGDCGDYHGWVVGVEQTGAPRMVSFEVASDGEGGAIWEAGGAPAVDAAGNLYVTTGNANPDPPEGGPDPKRYTESVVKLSPTLAPLASFKDTIAGGDEDLATGNPVLLPGGRLFAIGKTDVGYLLHSTDLSKIAAIPGVCGSDPDGGPAYDAATRRIFVPCKHGGIQEIDAAAAKIGPKLQGANGAPVLIGGELWAAQYPDGGLTEFRPGSGAIVQTLRTGAVPHFASPSLGGGHVLIGTESGVSAFG
jgi:polyvinyl alcohol dehydrogenase (cytochrome)